MKFVYLLALIFLISCSSPVVDGVASKPNTDNSLQWEPIKIKSMPPHGPEYPPKAKASRIQGVVSVYVHVSDQGENIRVYSGNGPEELRQAAEDYAKKCIFVPAKLNGKPTTARFTLNVIFNL